MPRSTPTSKGRQVAPGVHRLGDDTVNFYLIEHPDGLVLIDAGLPGHLAQLHAHLAATGHRVGDVRAVLITHAHPDHTGLAGTLHDAGARIWIHDRDAPILAQGPRAVLQLAKPERSILPYLLRRPAATGTALHFARKGAFTTPGVPGAYTFNADQRLKEIPGSPQTVAVPGHTPGSTAYLFTDRGLLFTGDALVTHDSLTGHTGPTLICRGSTHDSAAAIASLDRLDDLVADVLLPGHGEPIAGDLHATCQQARRTGIR